jgi:hypothetical protein
VSYCQVRSTSPAWSNCFGGVRRGDVVADEQDDDLVRVPVQEPFDVSEGVGYLGRPERAVDMAKVDRSNTARSVCSGIAEDVASEPSMSSMMDTRAGRKETSDVSASRLRMSAIFSARARRKPEESRAATARSANSRLLKTVLSAHPDMMAVNNAIVVTTTSAALSHRRIGLRTPGAFIGSANRSGCVNEDSPGPAGMRPLPSTHGRCHPGM